MAINTTNISIASAHGVSTVLEPPGPKCKYIRTRLVSTYLVGTKFRLAYQCMIIIIIITVVIVVAIVVTIIIIIIIAIVVLLLLL